MPSSDQTREAQSSEETPPPRRRTLRDGALMDHQIQEAMNRGAFDNLPGKGKPLDLDPRSGGADAIVAGILKEANVTPEWVQLSRQIDESKQQIAGALEGAPRRASEHRQAAEALLHRWRQATASPRETSWLARWRERSEDPARLESDLREVLGRAERRRAEAFSALALRVYDINRRTRRYNLVVPVPARQRSPLSLDETAAEFVRSWQRLVLARQEDDLMLREEAVEPPRPAPPAESEEERPARDPARLVALNTLVRGRRPPPIG
jgi:DnaJ-like protein